MNMVRSEVSACISLSVRSCSLHLRHLTIPLYEGKSSVSASTLSTRDANDWMHRTDFNSHDSWMYRTDFNQTAMTAECTELISTEHPWQLNVQNWFQPNCHDGWMYRTDFNGTSMTAECTELISTKRPWQLNVQNWFQRPWQLNVQNWFQWNIHDRTDFNQTSTNINNSWMYRSDFNQTCKMDLTIVNHQLKDNLALQDKTQIRCKQTKEVMQERVFKKREKKM